MVTANSIISELRTDRTLDPLLHRFEFSQEDYSSRIHAFCDKNDIDEGFFLLLIRSFSEMEECVEEDFSNIDVSQIIRYLKASHIYYQFKILPEIEQTSNRLARDLDVQSPLMIYLVSFIHSYKEELLDHIHEEEKKFFPYVLQLRNGIQTEDYSVAQFERFHEKHQFEIDLARKVLLAIGVPPEFESQLRFLDNQLKILQKDMAIHEFIEDLILVNKARALEDMIR
jgi:regulator of cell morphogenesis and NO signaling